MGGGGGGAKTQINGAEEEEYEADITGFGWPPLADDRCGGWPVPRPSAELQQ